MVAASSDPSLAKITVQVGSLKCGLAIEKKSIRINKKTTIKYKTLFLVSADKRFNHFKIWYLLVMFKGIITLKTITNLRFKDSSKSDRFTIFAKPIPQQWLELQLISMEL